MKTILVTGAGGFVGSNISDILIKKGYKVIGVYRSRTPIINGIDRKKIDLLQYKSIEDSLSEETIDVIIHLAGEMKSNKVIDYINNSVLTTKNLIDYAINHNVETFILGSSISVYGEVISSPTNELSERVNLDDYGTAKYISERLLEDSSIRKKYSLRLPRMLGKDIDYSYPWIPKLVYQLKNNILVKYYNPNLKYNNTLHCDDLADFIHFLIISEKEGYDFFVLASTEPMKVIEIIYYLKDRLYSDSILEEGVPQKKNSAYLIDASKAIENGLNNRTTQETFDRFLEDIK